MFPDAPPSIYSLIVGGAFAVGFLTVLLGARAAGVPTGRLILLQLGLAIFAHVGGRLYLLIELGAPWRWTDILTVGYRHPGSIIGVALGLAILPKVLMPDISLGLLTDCVAPAIAFSTVIMRIGCFTIGCCAGTVSSLPWAIRFPPESRVSRLHARLGLISSSALPSLPVHPLQLYFLALALGLGLLLLWLRARKSYDGQIFLLFLAIHEMGKAGFETLRENALSPASGMLVPMLSLIIGALAIFALVAVQRRARRNRVPILE